MNAANSAGCAGCYSEVAEVSFTLTDVAKRLEPTSILMCEPTFFEVKDVKNPFMEGNINKIDSTKARQQWDLLKQAFEKLGYPTKVIPGQPDLEDMVFAANQVLVGQDNKGQPYVVAAEMVHESRRKEVPYFLDWFKKHGYDVRQLPRVNDKVVHFEGQGDAIWHPGRQLLWGGYGNRTEEQAHGLISKLLDTPILLLKLATKNFYHLDTCFCPLNETTVMIFAGAFEAKGLELIRHFFSHVIEVSEKDAHNFACNALALGNNVVIQRGNADTCQQLKRHGLNPVEMDTGEFMRSGGSVFCLKMMIY